MPDLIGRTLGHYRITDKIGEGGMGEVYRAHDERLDRDVAIKVLHESVAQNADRLARFGREAKAVAALSHSNILEIFDFDTEGDVTYAVTELLEGETLREHLQKLGGPLPWKGVQEIGAAVARGLGAAHGRGVVHRDIKPSNIFLCSDGRVKVLDFGLAATHEVVDGEAETGSIEAPLTREGSVMGTVGYMAPEQVRGEPADHRSDIFALGCVLYEMLTGERAFKRDTTAEIMTAILREEPPSFAESGAQVPPDLAKTVSHCLEKNPERRFQSAADIAFALGSESEVAKSPVVPSEISRPRTWEMPLLAIAGILVVALGMVFGPGILERLGGQPEPPPIRSIALLPLENLTGDPEQAYFVDGLHEELIATFAQISAFDKVIARTSVMGFRDSDTPIREIGEQLKVAAVLEGSVRQAGDTVRVTLQLIDVRTESHLWADIFERDLTDILALQSEVARAVAQEIRIAVTPEEEERLTRARPVDPEVHEAYLRGRYHWGKWTAEGYNRAIEYFEEAIKKDPGYAPAHVGLADSYYFLAGLSGFLAPGEAAPKVKEAALRALELDDTLAEAHASMAAAMYRMDWDWIGAEREFKRALELNPNSAFCRHRYSYYLMSMGRLDAAIAEMRKALELDPLKLLSNTVLGFYYFVGNRFEEATRQIEKTIELDPSYPLARFNLGIIYLHQQRYDEAIDELQKARSLSGDSPGIIPDLARALAEAGREDEAFELVRELAARAERDYVSPGVMAWLYAGLGHKDEAFEWLETAYDERTWEMAQLRVDKHFDPIRDDPRFRDILLRMNFPEN